MNEREEWRERVRDIRATSATWWYIHVSTYFYHLVRFTTIYQSNIKKRSRRYPAKTITDADYADDIAILANTPNQAETLLHSLERAAGGIGLYVNAHKTEYKCYNQNVRIRDVALKTCQNRWTIGKSGERGSGISVPVIRHDIYIYIWRMWMNRSVFDNKIWKNN